MKKSMLKLFLLLFILHFPICSPEACEEALLECSSKQASNKPYCAFDKVNNKCIEVDSICSEVEFNSEIDCGNQKQGTQIKYVLIL